MGAAFILDQKAAADVVTTAPKLGQAAEDVSSAALAVRASALRVERSVTVLAWVLGAAYVLAKVVEAQGRKR